MKRMWLYLIAGQMLSIYGGALVSHGQLIGILSCGVGGYLLGDAMQQAFRASRAVKPPPSNFEIGA